MANVPTAVIDPAAIAANLDVVRRHAPNSKIMAIIKANAYGHGRRVLEEGLQAADAFGVARVEEAIGLREAGIEKPVVVLEGFLDREELEEAVRFDLQVVVHDPHQLDTLKSFTGAVGVWIKVDTGMNRLGLHPREFAEAMEKAVAHMQLKGIMSHFANADDPSDAMTRRQIERFDALTKGYDCPISLANSAAVLSFPASHRDWVRPGIMLYGASPFAGGKRCTELRSAMTLEAPIVAVRQVGEGESVGYGADWRAEKPTRVAVLSIGYGDGYPREMPFGTPVLIGGHRRPIVGRISMDMTCVALEPDDRVKAGEMAILWGEALPIEEVAACAGTIPYTLLTGLTTRVNRRYRTGDGQK